MRFLDRHAAYFQDSFLMPTFIDNHDMDRFLYLAGGDKEALRRAAAVQMRLPRPAHHLLRTEVGLSQTRTTREGMGLHVSRVRWPGRRAGPGAAGLLQGADRERK